MDRWAWAEIAMTASVLSIISTGRALRSEKTLRDFTNIREDPITVKGRLMYVMSGPILLSALDGLIGQFPAGDIEVLSTVENGVIPEGIVITRDSTWPSGWG